MKSFRLALYLLLVATSVGSLWWAWRQQREIEELRAAAMQKSERADLQKRVWDLEKSNRDLRDQLAERGGGAAGPDTSGTPRGNVTSAAGRGNRVDPRRDAAQMIALRELVAKPEMQALISREQRLNVETRYAALFKGLNLPPDQTEKLKSLLVERLATAQDVLTAAFDQGVNPRENADDLRKLMTDAQNDINRSIRAAIGEPAFAQLSAYEQTLPQRALVNELQLRLSATDAPLSTGQADQLVQILAANPAPKSADAPERPALPSGPPRGPDFGAILGGGSGSAAAAVTVTPAAMAQAQSVLSPVQVGALQQMQQQQQTQQQLRQMYNDALTAPRSTVPVAPPPRK